MTQITMFIIMIIIIFSLGSKKGDSNENFSTQLNLLQNSLLMSIVDTSEKELTFLLLIVYVSCPINFDLSLDPNDPDETYAKLIITTSLILISLLLKYESLTHQ